MDGMAKRRAALAAPSAGLSFSGVRGAPHARAKYSRGVAIASILSAAFLSLRCGSRTFDLLPDEDGRAGGGQRSGSGAGARAGGLSAGGGGSGGKVGQGGRNNPPGGFVGFGGSGGRGDPPLNPVCAAHVCAQNNVSCPSCDDRCDEECVCGRWCVGCPAPCGDGLQCDPLTSDRCVPSCDDSSDCRGETSETGEPLPFCRLGFRPTVCVECIEDAHCGDELRDKFCHLGRCIECFSADDCPTASLPVCNARGRCVECTNSMRHCEAGDVCDDGVCRH